MSLGLSLSPTFDLAGNAAVRRRRDLEIRPLRFEGRRMWGLKDPLALRYLQLNDEEFWLFEQLDGRRSLEELRAAFERQFAPRRLDLATLDDFVRQLHREGLVIVETDDQGRLLLQRRNEERRHERRPALRNVVSIRFRGLDPEPLLRRVYPWVRPVFTPIVGLLAAASILAAALLTATQWSTFRARLPALDLLFDPSNIVVFVLLMSLTKVLHEFGHALACKHFGGECHEMGVMLFLGMPTLYCNVSDSWMLADKRARIAVAAAGIIVELVLAALCTFVWWFTEQSLLNTCCLMVMGLCTVNTLLLNGNPLLRYDGYHMLSDWLEIPHLSRRVDDVWRRAAAVIWFGTDAVAEPYEDERASLGRRLWFAAYSLASKVYSWIVVLGALWLLNVWAKPYGLAPAARLLTLAAVIGMVAPAIAATSRRLKHPAYASRVRRPRFWAATIVALLLAATIAVIPWPRSTANLAVLQPAEAATVYVSQAGFLDQAAAPGDVVAPGDVLATLHDDDLARDIVRLRTERDRLAAELKVLELRQAIEKSKVVDVRTARHAVDDVEELLAVRLEDEERLTLRAPQAGKIVPPTSRPLPKSDGTALPNWSGSPLDVVNRAAYLETGTPLCVVGDPNRMDAVALVEQAEVMHVYVGRRVRLLLPDVEPSERRGTITEVAQIDTETTPPELQVLEARLQRSAAALDAAGAPTRYRVRIRLDSPLPAAVLDRIVPIRIDVDAESLAAKALRLLRRSIRF